MAARVGQFAVMELPGGDVSHADEWRQVEGPGGSLRQGCGACLVKWYINLY